MKRIILLIFLGACIVVLGVAAAMSPVSSQSRPRSQAPVITTPLPDIPGDAIHVTMFRNGKCLSFVVPAKRMSVEPSEGGPAEETATLDEAAYNRMVPPIDPKLHRPPTPAESEACAQAGPGGRPPDPPVPGGRPPGS